MSRMLNAKREALAAIPASTLRIRHSCLRGATCVVISAGSMPSLPSAAASSWLGPVPSPSSSVAKLDPVPVAPLNPFARIWAADPLVTYQINPFSIFYIGSTRSYANIAFGDDGPPRWKLIDRTYFLKLQYLIQL